MEDYSQHLLKKGYSVNTITAHSYYARKFSQYLDQQALDIDTIKTNDIYHYLEQTRQKNENSTYNSELSSIKVLFSYLSEKYSNPVLKKPAQFRSLKFKKLPCCTNLEAIFKIEMLLRNSTKIEDFEKIILLLIMNHGMNPVDIIQLKIEDINFKDSILSYSKNNITLCIKLFNEDQNHFFNYFKNKHHGINDQLLIDMKYKSIKKYHIHKLFKKLERYDIYTNPTQLRNRFILDSLNVGIPALYVATYVGITSLNQILRFETLTDEYILKGKIEINKLRMKEGYNHGKIKQNRGSSIPLQINVKRREDTNTRNTAQ